MNKIKKFLPISFCLIFFYFLNTGFISTGFAQIFEVNEEDYFSSEEKEEDYFSSEEKEEEQQEEEQEDVKTTTNSKDSSAATSTNSEDTDKETCIDGNRIESVATLSPDNDKNSDSYYSDFHFIKKFDKNGTLVDSWGNVGPQDGQFLHAHGITIDSKDNVYVSDAEKCNIQKFDKDGNFITKWGTKGIGPGEFLQPESMAIDSLDNIYLAEYSRKTFKNLTVMANL